MKNTVTISIHQSPQHTTFPRIPLGSHLLRLHNHQTCLRLPSSAPLYITSTHAKPGLSGLVILNLNHFSPASLHTSLKPISELLFTALIRQLILSLSYSQRLFSAYRQKNLLFGYYLCCILPLLKQQQQWGCNSILFSWQHVSNTYLWRHLCKLRDAGKVSKRKWLCAAELVTALCFPCEHTIRKPVRIKNHLCNSMIPLHRKNTDTSRLTFLTSFLFVRSKGRRCTRIYHLWREVWLWNGIRVSTFLQYLNFCVNSQFNASPSKQSDHFAVRYSPTNIGERVCGITVATNVTASKSDSSLNGDHSDFKCIMNKDIVKRDC